MNKIVIVALALVLAVSVFVYSQRPGESTPQPKQEVHLHAGFQVYVDNRLQDFSDFKYMNFKSCSEHTHEDLTPEEEQLERAHLHDFVDDVVHVHREGATWGDLFKNINYEISPEVVYINGELFEGDFLSHEIHTYDSAIIIIGENTNIEEKLANAVTKEHIVEVESMSEYCGSE